MFHILLSKLCFGKPIAAPRAKQKNLTILANTAIVGNMKLYLINHDMRYAAESVLLTLFPGERPEYSDGKPDGDRCEIALHEGTRFFTTTSKLVQNGKTFFGKAAADKRKMPDELTKTRYLQRIIKLSFFRAAICSGVTLPVWGSLTGIRPGKLMTKFLESGLSERSSVSRFMREYDVTRERAQLCLHTAKAGLKCAESLENNDICLYVGIPFCPTRCSYCSFVSQSVHRSMKLIPEFLSALFQEIGAVGKLARETRTRPVSLYVGGGTPTTLSAEELDALFTRLEAEFDFSLLREITVEAGRPDTITRGKLEALKRHGVTRISVNPQSMNDCVLVAIGRKHSAGNVLEAIELVRAVGGFQVNMDIIAGLPGDTPELFKKSLNLILSLNPENITVHTLALKKGSEIMLANTIRPSPAQVGEMLDYAISELYAAGFEPYYLYRQKYMSGGFENVGWQRGGTENIYNIAIMEELCSIISLGGGASTKLCLGNGRIERVFNPKYPQEYIEGIGKIISDKTKIKEKLQCRFF